jgi:hypothetical protein
MWKANENTTTLLLFLDSLFPKTEIHMRDSSSGDRGISYMKYVNGRRTGLVTFYVETAFYNGLLKERYKEGTAPYAGKKKLVYSWFI